MKNVTPADQGIEASRQDASEMEFMTKKMDEFKAHVLEAMRQGIHKDFSDHFDFLEMCMENFIDLEQGE